jgi:hypothetical protein
MSLDHIRSFTFLIYVRCVSVSRNAITKWRPNGERISISSTITPV